MDTRVLIQRLSYIKYLYLKGVEQSRQAEVVAGFSILAFHDAVEMFLMLVYEHLDCDKAKNRKTFDEYLGSIPGITMKESVKSLNNCRISLKHHGLLPANKEIEKHRINTHSFLQENTSTLLKLDFDKISLIDLVSFEECKQYLQKAQEELSNKKWFNCIVEAKKAFNSMLDEYEAGKKDWYNSIFNIGIKPRDSYKDFIRDNCKNNRNWYEIWFEDVDKTINALRDTVKIISMGIDYKQYALFKTITPEIWRTADGSFKVMEVESHFNDRINANQELCDFCINFVIDCAVKFKESDYEITSHFKNPYGPTRTISF